MDETPNLFRNCDREFSLEKMCFDLIVKNFERFHFGYTVSKDVNLQRNFEFLQRRFSEQLIPSLYVDKTLKEEYFQFLLNEHLNLLNGKWLENRRQINSLENIFLRLSNLTELCFRHCGDDVLENVAKFCPKIVEIDVRFSKVTDNGVKHLCDKNGMVPCPEIKILFIENSSVTDRGAECLIRSLPLLQKIDYRNVPVLLHCIHQDNLARCQRVQSYNFVKINLSEFQHLPNFIDILKTCLTVCPRLESLDCSVTDKQQLDIFANSRLKELDLSMINVNVKFNIDSFIKKIGYNLTSLAINNCIISVSSLAEHCPHLKGFYVDNVNFTEKEDDVQISFPCLLICCFKAICPSSAKGFCLLLSSSPKLESITFAVCRLSLKMKNQILMWCKNSSAEEIGFRHLKLEMKFVRDILLSCPFLTFMCLYSCSFDVYNTEDFLESFAKRLPNKPDVFIIYYSELFDSTDSDLVEDSALYLRLHPDQIYESSNIYESLFQEIALKWNDYDSDEDVSH